MKKSYSFLFLWLGWFPFSRMAWILESLITRGMNVGNPLWHTNYTMRLLCWKFEFESTCFHLSLLQKMTLISWGGMTRGNISSMFQLDLKKKHNTISILCFLVPTTAFKTKPQTKKKINMRHNRKHWTTKCKCNMHNLQVISARF